MGFLYSMKKIIMLLAIATFANNNNLFSQVAQCFFAELGGPGLASINYDTRLTKKDDGIGLRLGLGGLSVDYESVILVPIGVNYLLGNDKKHYFELGANITIASASNGSSGTFTSSFGTLNMGYRLQPLAGGFMFRASINPIFTNSGFFPFYAGISFGYKF
jgi:hypothetical protein